MTVPLADGVTAWPGTDQEQDDPPGVVMVGYPNYLGCIEDLAAARALCDRTGALLVVGADPVAAGLLKSAGQWGADVVVGEGQVFGTTLGFGGPYLGLFACAAAHVRRLPGRLVGETVDVEGRRAYVTTLRAREQDIRREKATSNVCTNQTLMAVTAAIQLGWLGTARPGRAGPPVRPGHPVHPRRAARPRPGGRRTPAPRSSGSSPSACRSRPRWSSSGWPTPASWPASPLGDEFDDGDHGLLVSVTERRTRDEIDAYVDRPGQGGGLMTDTARRTRTGEPPGARPTSAPLLGRASRAHPLRAVPSGPAGLVVPDHRRPRAPRRRAGPRRPPPRRPGPAGRGLRAGPGGPLHPALPPAVLGGPRGLPARLLHHEVQPEGVRHGGRPARPGRGPPGGARPRSPRAGSGCMVELEETLCEITGMAAATLQPAAGAAGELTGLLLMRAWHAGQGSRPPQGDHPRLGPRHQSGLGHPRRLRGGHRPERRPRAASTWPRWPRCSTRTWPASCSPTPTPWGCSRRTSPPSPPPSTRWAGCSTTTGPTSTPSSAWSARATWASTSST